MRMFVFFCAHVKMGEISKISWEFFQKKLLIELFKLFALLQIIGFINKVHFLGFLHFQIQIVAINQESG